MRIEIYDKGGRSYDRYTVVFLDSGNSRNGMYECLGMSEDPFHPQGFGQHSECQRGRHLGKRIRFEDLPEPCRELVLRDLA